MLKRFFFLVALQTPLLAIAAEECKTAQCREKAVMQREVNLQAKFPGKIQRKGETLAIRATSGKTHTFINNRSEDYSKHIVYDARSAIPHLDWVIIGVSYYEGSGHLLISLNSGEVLEFDGYEEPILSPDGQRLLAYSQDLEAGYDPNFIAIYKMDRNKASQEILLDGGNVNFPSNELWGPSQPRWLDNTTVAYDENRFGADRYASGGPQTIPIQLKLRNGKWQKSVIGKSPAVKNN